MHDRNETSPRRAANATLAALFVAGIALPCVGTFLRLDTGGMRDENRKMADPPSLTKGKLKEYPRRAEAWFNDHFGMRNSLVRAYSLVQVKVLHGIASARVVQGRDGWLFYAEDKIIEMRRGLLPFSEGDLRQWQTLLEERRDWLASQNIRYVFMFAPEKSSLYAEFLPAYLAPVRDQTRLDQFLAWMRAHSTVEALDLRESLRAAKSEGRIYHRTDTHWNEEGAFAAYRQIAAWLKKEFPRVTPIERGEFEPSVLVTPGGDLAGMLALTSILHEERRCLIPKTPSAVRAGKRTETMTKRPWIQGHEPVVFERDNAEIPRAVVVHDSFFDMARPFLSRHFGRSTFVSWYFIHEIIADEKPDVVIEEMVERVLSRPVPVNEPPVAGSRPAK
jgi:hypothetical protein